MQQDPQEAAVQQQHSVPADDTQTACAISGEKFEEYFDEVKQEWRYRDAERLTGADAQKYGVPDGSIVLVSCLTSASVLDAELGSVVKVTNDMQQVEHELSEATEPTTAADVAILSGKRESQENDDALAMADSTKKPKLEGSN